MAGLIEAFSDSGFNLYTMIRNVAGQTWNTSIVAFQNWNPANWTDYAVAMTEDTSSGFYSVAVPAAITAQRLTILIYNRAGGTPAVGDQSFGNSTGIWDGSTWESGWSTTARTLTTLAGVGGVDVQKINGVAAAAVKLGVSADSMIQGSAIAGTLTVSQMTTNLSYTTNKILFGRVVYFTSTPLLGQVGAISAYDGTTKKITFFTPLTAAPIAGTTFIIV